MRAAWGAQARFLGAPARFKYIAQAPLKRLFMGEATDIPHDAIYVLEDALFKLSNVPAHTISAPTSTQILSGSL